MLGPSNVGHLHSKDRSLKSWWCPGLGGCPLTSSQPPAAPHPCPNLWPLFSVRLCSFFYSISVLFPPNFLSKIPLEKSQPCLRGALGTGPVWPGSGEGRAEGEVGKGRNSWGPQEESNSSAPCWAAQPRERHFSFSLRLFLHKMGLLLGSSGLTSAEDLAPRAGREGEGPHHQMLACPRGSWGARLLHAECRGPKWQIPLTLPPGPGQRPAWEQDTKAPASAPNRLWAWAGVSVCL